MSTILVFTAYYRHYTNYWKARIHLERDYESREAKSATEQVTESNGRKEQILRGHDNCPKSSAGYTEQVEQI